MTFQPYPTRSGFVALALAIIFGAAAIFLCYFVLLALTSLNPDELSEMSYWVRSVLDLILNQDRFAAAFVLFVGFLLALLITINALYWAVITIKLNYQLDRNSLAIQWGLTQYHIPFDTINAVISGQDMGQDMAAAAQFWEINVAGLRLGRGRMNDNSPLKFRTTASLADSVLVTTARQTYVISPRQPERFLRAWQERQALGTTQQWPATIHRSWPLNAPLLADRLAWWFLGIAALLWLILAGYFAWNYADLPASLPIHFNALGRADRITGKFTLLILPAAGAIVWLVNALLGELIYLKERLAAYFLWAGALVMQVCLGVALRMIMG
jgi:uncharacterized membrane protein